MAFLKSPYEPASELLSGNQGLTLSLRKRVGVFYNEP